MIKMRRGGGGYIRMVLRQPRIHESRAASPQRCPPFPGPMSSPRKSSDQCLSQIAVMVYSAIPETAHKQYILHVCDMRAASRVPTPPTLLIAACLHFSRRRLTAKIPAVSASWKKYQDLYFLFWLVRSSTSQASSAEIQRDWNASCICP